MKSIINAEFKMSGVIYNIEWKGETMKKKSMIIISIVVIAVVLFGLSMGVATLK